LIVELAKADWKLVDIVKYVRDQRKVAVTYYQVMHAAHAAGVRRIPVKHRLSDVLQNPEAVNAILANATEARKRYGFSNDITTAVRKRCGLIAPKLLPIALKALHSTIQIHGHLETVELTEKVLASLPRKTRGDAIARKAAARALKEGWLIKSSNSKLDGGFLYAKPEFLGKVVTKNDFDFYFDPQGRGIGEVVASIIDSQPKALTLEEVRLQVRDAIGLNMNVLNLSKLLRHSKLIGKWGRNHKLLKGYLYFTRPEQLTRRLDDKESLLSPTLRLILKQTVMQCLTLTQCASICHITEGLAKYGIDKLSLLGLRKTELFHGLRLVYDPSMPENEVAMAKQNIEAEIRRQAEMKFVHGDVFACYGALCIILDQLAHNLCIVKTEIHFGRHKGDASDLHLFGRQGLVNEKLMVEFKSGSQLKLSDARAFCEKLRHQQGVTKALMVYRHASAKALSYFSATRDYPLQWVSESTLTRRYRELIGYRVTAEMFGRFLDDMRFGFSYLKEVLENNPMRLKQQLMNWLGTRDITVRVKVPESEGTEAAAGSSEASSANGER